MFRLQGHLTVCEPSLVRVFKSAIVGCVFAKRVFTDTIGELDENDLTPTPWESLAPLLREIKLDLEMFKASHFYWKVFSMDV